MDIKMLKQRIWNSVSNILFSDVRGGGQNGYRNTKVRIALSAMVRIGWIEKGWIGHFEKTLWQDAKLIIEQGEWTGTISDLMVFRFWHHVAIKAGEEYTSLGVKFRRQAAEPYQNDSVIWSKSELIVDKSASRKRRAA
tara:strand:+ start:246 stop:659 length:414 start_codon:yes stop_codon:yes gene_type:complete